MVWNLIDVPFEWYTEKQASHLCSYGIRIIDICLAEQLQIHRSHMKDPTG